MERYQVYAICVASGLVAGVIMCLISQYLISRRCRRRAPWLIKQFRDGTLIVVEGHDRTGFLPSFYRLYGALPEVMREALVHVIITDLSVAPVTIEGLRLLSRKKDAGSFRIFEGPDGHLIQVSDTEVDGDTCVKEADRCMALARFGLKTMPQWHEAA